MYLQSSSETVTTIAFDPESDEYDQCTLFDYGYFSDRNQIQVFKDENGTPVSLSGIDSSKWSFYEYEQLFIPIYYIQDDYLREEGGAYPQPATYANEGYVPYETYDNEAYDYGAYYESYEGNDFGSYYESYDYYAGQNKDSDSGFYSGGSYEDFVYINYYSYTQPGDYGFASFDYYANMWESYESSQEGQD